MTLKITVVSTHNIKNIESLKTLIPYLFLIVCPIIAYNQEVSFLFMGDIECRELPIGSAYQDSSKIYSYDEVFKPVKEIISSVDFAVANLELTLVGEPYKGYPQFSSTEKLVVACKENDIDILVTANNHSCDRGNEGVIRTVNILDSIGIKHTGTFSDQNHRDSLNLLILESKGIKVGLLNYTFGTNSIPYSYPAYVNLLDSSLIQNDVLKAKSRGLDKLIIFVHWGNEFEDLPNTTQKKYNEFFKSIGVDVVIGSHPKVIQPMEYYKDTISGKETLTAYSLGNFISHQRQRRRDGGAMLRLSFIKSNNQIKIKQKDYILTWLHKYNIEDRNHYQILPCTHEKYDSTYFKKVSDFSSMNIFIDESRKYLKENNLQVAEGAPQLPVNFNPIHPEKIGLNSSKNKVKALKLKFNRRKFFRKKRSNK